MRYFYDSEFRDTGSAVELISIGIVAEDGRECYFVLPNAMDICNNDQWLMENVAPSLPLDPLDNRFLDFDSPHVLYKTSIRRRVHEFLSYDGSPELWGWFVSYDHLVLSQLWGRMIDVPSPIPQFSNDIRSLASWCGINNLPKQIKGHHNALEDARHNKVVFDYIMKEIGNV